MNEKLELFLPVDPVDLPSAQQKGAMIRHGHIMFYETSRVKTARKRLVELLITAAKGETFTAPAYQVTIVYVYRPVTIRKRDFGMPKVTRPDVDNLTKLVLDAISDSHIAWQDDGAVSTLCLRKRYAYGDENPFVYVLIERETQGQSDDLGIEL